MHEDRKKEKIDTMKTLTKHENLYSHEFERKLNENSNAILLDVRTVAEFQSERLPNAINIDVMESDFLEKIGELDKTKTYFVSCRSGARSGQACGHMSGEGLTAFNLAGGILNWRGKTE
jgi:rhodanese-related sulfurtransferase